MQRFIHVHHTSNSDTAALRRTVSRTAFGEGIYVKSGRRDSNPRRPAWEAGILPLNYARKLLACKELRKIVRRLVGLVVVLVVTASA